MFLSVIIPTRNRYSLLNKTLNSILEQNYSQELFEVIVIDNGSTDDTKVICNSYKTKFKNFIYLYDETPGLHIGRHLGLKHSKGDVLVYGDDDIKAFPTWLSGIYETFSQFPEAVLVGGKNLPDYEVKPPEWEKYLWDVTSYGKINIHYSVLDLGDEIREISPYYVFGCNFSIRKKTLIDAGGFHPDGMPKELIKFRGDGESAVSGFIQERKLKTVYNPKASVYHHVSSKRMTFEYIYERMFGQGISGSYSDIRKNNRNKFSYDIIFFKQLLKLFLIKLFSEQLKYKILKLNFDGYNAGYKFHHDNVYKDPEMLKWVLKENYY